MMPSLEDVILNQIFALPVEVTSVQAAPELVDVQMFPAQHPPPGTPTPAASLLPSLEEVMSPQYCISTEADQVAPESIEIQMLVPLETVASYVPSLEDVMLCQLCELPMDWSSILFSPESIEAQIFPP